MIIAITVTYLTREDRMIYSEDTIKIVCTVYPAYDWAKEVTSGIENVEITLLTDNGINLHNYTPTVADIAKIKNSDLFIYVGGHSEEWVNDLASEQINSLNLINELDDLIIEDHGHSEEEEHSHEDEHIWMSIKYAKELAQVIANKMIILDSENEAVYTENANNYIAKLAVIDDMYEEEIAASPKNAIVVADQYAYAYIVRDYNLVAYSAFDSCSADSEVSVETLTSLATSADENNITKVIIDVGSDKSIANTILQSSNAEEIIEIDSMQSVNLSNEVKSYIELLEENLEKFKEALN